MKKMLKKAFTLVELLVVIAILAALATVGIISFSAYTKKANHASDNSLLSQLNHHLVLMEDQPANYTEMKEFLDEEAGVQIDRISTFTKDCKYAWNIEENKLYLVDNNSTIIEPADDTSTIDAKDRYKYFVAVDSDDEVESGNYAGFSCYLKDNATISNNEVAVSASVDTGNNAVTSVKYTGDDNNPKTVVIRTNSINTTLKIDAAKDTVNHYDIVSNVTINKIAANSYHEYGTCAYVECTSGRVVAENGGLIDTVVLKETNEETKASVLTGNGTINNIYATSSAVVEGNNNETAAHDTLDNIIVLETTESHTLDNAIQDAKDSAYNSTVSNIQENCEHSYENGSCIKCGKLDSSWFEDIENMDVADLTPDENGEYNITSAIDLAVLSRMSSDGNTFDNKTVNLINSINMQNKKFNPILSFKGTFNGNNNTISNLNVNVIDNSSNAGLFSSLEKANISNLTISDSTFSKKGANVGCLAGIISSGTVNNVTIQNCIATGTDDYTGGLVGSGYSEIQNCTIKSSSITGKEQTGGLIGYMWVGSLYNNKVENCSIESTADRAGGLIGKFQCSSGNVGNSIMHVDNNTVSKCTIIAPNVCGGLIGQVMGNSNQYTIKGNSVEVYLNCESTKNLLWNLRADQGEDFVNALNNTDYVDKNTSKAYNPTN